MSRNPLGQTAIRSIWPWSPFEHRDLVPDQQMIRDGAIVVAPLCPCRWADRREAARQRRHCRGGAQCSKLKSTVSDHLRERRV